MTPFLYRLAKVFYKRYENTLHEHTFVFPSRRAGIFFQKHLTEISPTPLFSPTILTIQELFEELSPYQTGDKIGMLIILYNEYVKISGSNESFDDFLYWGEMLLNDFNDVDKYLIDAKQLFCNVQDLRSLDSDMSYLSEQQINAIRNFWEHFIPVEGNETKKKFQETWQILLELYTAFRNALHERGYAYEGMLFREVAERAKANEDLHLRFKNIVFVGLNALTPAETILLEYLKNRGIADFYWDYDSPFVRDKQNKASFWATGNLLHFPSQFETGQATEAEEKGKQKIELIGVPSAVGQAKQVGTILSQLIASGAIDPDEAINTAIVLPDENLLLPVLYSIPQKITKINVTMGYGLSHSSIASLIEHIADLQRNLRKSDDEIAFYYRFVLAILHHPLITLASKTETETLKTYITENNRILIFESEIPSHPLLKLVFRPITQWKQIAEYLQSVLVFLYNCLTEEKYSEEETNNETHPVDLEREFIVQYYKSITRLQETLGEVKTLSVDTYFRLLKQLTQNLSVPFSGEPLSGLQIMGVLETRVLDFENLIILSMNEGVFPQKKSLNSFIPFTLHKGFGLPTYEHQESTYAYHFYRLINRAKRIFMLYDTRTEELQTGEVSRYFYQLKYLYNSDFDIEEHVLTYDVSAPDISPIVVAKTPHVLQKLDAFKAGGNNYLSASLINRYITCPLQFYFSAIEELSTKEEVQESVEAEIFGTIYHSLMENIYRRFIGKTVTPDALTALAENDTYLTEWIEKAFAEHYFKNKDRPQPLQGQYFLIGEILRSYVKQTLEADKQFTPFQYIGAEYRFKSIYHVTDNLSVNFKGIIDRIDQIKDEYRIIDYKTGSGTTNFNDIPQLFDSSKNNRPAHIFQVFVYALFYAKENPGKKLSPAIYYLRSIFNNFDPSVTYQKQKIEDISVFFDEFTRLFNNCLEEIFDEKIPFTQTQQEKNCQWCTFKDVCGR